MVDLRAGYIWRQEKDINLMKQADLWENIKLAIGETFEEMRLSSSSRAPGLRKGKPGQHFSAQNTRNITGILCSGIFCSKDIVKTVEMQK